MFFTSLWEERANLSAFRTFVRFVLVWFCWFPLPLGVWEGLLFVIVALPGFFFHLSSCIICCLSVNKTCEQVQIGDCRVGKLLKHSNPAFKIHSKPECLHYYFNSSLK